MSALALLLIAVGLSDLVAARGWAHRQVGRRAGALVGLASLAVLAALGGLGSWGDVLLLTVAGLTTGAWVVLAGRADDADRGQGLALASLVTGAGLLLALSGLATPVGGALQRWLAWTDLQALQSTDATRVLLLAGLLLVQVSTGNVIVRLVLAHTGALDPRGGPQAADRLRGGRLLGPMERVFILGLGLAGQVTAASMVIAAKGLIRWPELQRATRDTERRDGAALSTEGVPPRWTAMIDQVTEYFLIGSFVSWLVALTALVLAHLA